MRASSCIARLGLMCVAALPAYAQMKQHPTEAWTGGDTYTFETAAPAAVGFDADKLERAAETAEDGGANALIVVRRGTIALERYWNGKSADDVQQMYSATKSPFAFLVGRAIVLGHVKSLDQPIGELVPEIAGGGRETLTFRSIMAMESGLEQSRAMDRREAQAGLSQLEIVQGREVTAAPFTHYIYNNAAYRLLFTALERATGMSLPEFTAQELFAPLGMQGAYWMQWRDGDRVMGYQSIRMRPRDMVKVGLVMLNGGIWAGERYLTASYGEQMITAPAPEVNPSYGLFWHLNSGAFYLSYYESERMPGRLLPGTPPDAFCNYGHNGQVVVCVPSLELVWVRTGDAIASTLWERDNAVAELSRRIVDATADE